MNLATFSMNRSLETVTYTAGQCEKSWTELHQRQTTTTTWQTLFEWQDICLAIGDVPEIEETGRRLKRERAAGLECLQMKDALLQKFRGTDRHRQDVCVGEREQPLKGFMCVCVFLPRHAWLSLCHSGHACGGFGDLLKGKYSLSLG